MTRRGAANFQPFDQCDQFLTVCSQNMPCMAFDAWKLDGHHPLLLAHLQSADDRGIVIWSGALERGPSCVSILLDESNQPRVGDPRPMRALIESDEIAKSEQPKVTLGARHQSPR